MYHCHRVPHAPPADELQRRVCGRQIKEEGREPQLRLPVQLARAREVLRHRKLGEGHRPPPLCHLAPRSPRHQNAGPQARDATVHPRAAGAPAFHARQRDVDSSGERVENIRMGRRRLLERGQGHREDVRLPGERALLFAAGHRRRGDWGGRQRQRRVRRSPQPGRRRGRRAQLPVALRSYPCPGRSRHRTHDRDRDYDDQN
mmetsp:Transcript_15741/g.31329  ORF Transcript_15741/g.31329 Transcript_15741/m.31329 type:complete len:202 (+) Transcript_15741:592-1197(+)